MTIAGGTEGKIKRHRILITGAGGFIGSALFDRLRDLEPIAVDHDFKAIPAGPFWRDIDLCNAQQVRLLMEEVRPDTVFHLAALSSPKRNEEDPARAREMNIRVTENVLGALPPDAHVIFPSTDKVFDGVDPAPDESAAPNPQWLYARLKLEGEGIVRGRALRHHIVRLGIVHSLGERWAISRGAGPGSFIDKAMVDMRAGKPAVVFENVQRCYVRLSRLVELFHAMLDDEHYGLYHVGSPMMTYYTRMKQLCAEAGISPDLLLPRAGTATPMAQNLDTGKLKAVFKVVFD